MLHHMEMINFMNNKFLAHCVTVLRIITPLFGKHTQSKYRTHFFIEHKICQMQSSAIVIVVTSLWTPKNSIWTSVLLENSHAPLWTWELSIERTAVLFVGFCQKSYDSHYSLLSYIYRCLASVLASVNFGLNFLGFLVVLSGKRAVLKLWRFMQSRELVPSLKWLIRPKFVRVALVLHLSPGPNCQSWRNVCYYTSLPAAMCPCCNDAVHQSNLPPPFRVQPFKWVLFC